jgi:DNA polymerase-3 subunit beta
MKLSVSKKQIVPLVKTASKIVVTKPTMPVAGMFLLTLKGNVLEITATDLDREITVKVDVVGEENDAFAVDAKLFAKIVENAPDGQLNFISSKNALTISWGIKQEAKLAFVPAADFPRQEVGSQQTSFNIQVGLLKEILNTVSVGFGTAPSPSLNGICIDSYDGNATRFVATDGNKLGLHAVPCVESDTFTAPTNAGKFIIPTDTWDSLISSETPETQIFVQLNETQAVLAGDCSEIRTKLVEGPYPNYVAVIPTAFTNTAEFDKKSLIDTMKRISAMTMAQNNYVRLAFKPNVCEMSSMGTNSSITEVASTTFTGAENFQIAFNANLLLKALNACEADTVCLDMNEPMTAVKVTDGGNEQKTFIVMPLQLISVA